MERRCRSNARRGVAIRVEPTALRGEGRAAAVEHRRGPTVLVVDDDRMSVLMIARVASAGVPLHHGQKRHTAWREFVQPASTSWSRI